MRVIWFNWRDIKYPDAGGAELFTHEIMRRLVQKRYDMTLFAARIPNRVKSETIGAVKKVRRRKVYGL